VPLVTSLQPASYARSGGVSVTVSGANFIASPLLRLQFGTFGIYTPRFLSSTALTFTLPVAATEGTVPILISNNNLDYSATTVPFVYFGTSVHHVGCCLIRDGVQIRCPL
jgi:hypothetical protein